MTEFIDFEYNEKDNIIHIPEYAWRELHMNFIEQSVYAISYSFGFINMSLEALCIRGGIRSEKTMQQYLTNMVKKGYLAKRVFKITGTKKRVVYTHMHDRYGLRSEEAIKASLDRAEESIKKYYTKTTPIGAYYMRKAKKNK